MAISHVWSDGTGVGRKSVGTVNTCLFRFFTSIASQLGCVGLWWDAISLPTSQDELREAMKITLLNYENASVTIVRDQVLTEFEWKDDGSPTVALVLSPWFSRGWTAAELFASRHHPVKVLFKNPVKNGHLLVLKDPDTDALACVTWSLFDLPGVSDIEPDILEANELFQQAKTNIRHSTRPPQQGYFAASDAIQQLRKNRCFEGIQKRKERGYLQFGLTRLEDLLRVVRTRTTCWHRDRLIIAGLMVLAEKTFDISAPGAGITQRLLRRYRRIRTKDLYHTSMTVTGRGPWSWCPLSIYDFAQMYQDDPFTKVCDIENAGRLTGYFCAWPLLDENRVTPVGTHPAIATCVSEALIFRPSYLLLTHNDYASTAVPLHDRVFILVLAVSQADHHLAMISCVWVACVGSAAGHRNQHSGSRMHLW